LFHANRQTDMTKLIITVRNFTDAPKIIVIFFEIIIPARFSHCGYSPKYLAKPLVL
jgi:hypothetical protein